MGMVAGGGGWGRGVSWGERGNEGEGRRRSDVECKSRVKEVGRSRKSI